MREPALDVLAAAKHIAAFVTSRPAVVRASGVCRAIGIVGGPGLGKTTMSALLRQLLDDTEVAHLDSYLLPRAERRALGTNGFEPRGFNLAAAVRDVRAFLETGAPLQLRPYLRDGTHGEASPVPPARTVFFDGVAVWLAPELRALMDTLLVSSLMSTRSARSGSTAISTTAITHATKQSGSGQRNGRRWNAMSCLPSAQPIS